MKITVIGHFCLDVIHRPDGTETTGYGGIYFAVAALANIAAEGDVIFPVFGIGEGEFESVKRALARYPNVVTEGIYSFTGETNRVHLFYENETSRTECSKSIASPIPFSRIEPYLSVHGVFLDMISGYDITLETLDQIRLAVRLKNVPIHLDLHSATLGVKVDFTRFRRPLSDWRRWCFMIGSVQMNEEEAEGLTIEKYDEESLAKQMLPLMVSAFCVTRGAKGVTLFRQEHKRLLRDEYSGIAVDSRDPTGCGDVFGSAFLYQYCRTKRYDAAAEFANRVAALNSSLAGSGNIDELSRFRAANGGGK